MARKRKKSKSIKVAGFRVPKPLVKSAYNVAKTPLGRIILAEALIHAASFVIRKPGATASAVESGAANVADTTRSLTGSLSEGAVNFMHAAADRLRAGAGLDGDPPKAGANADKKAVARKNGSVWDHLDQDTIRQALMGDFARKKKSKKAKAARRH